MEMLDLLRGRYEFKSDDPARRYMEETHSAGRLERLNILLPTGWSRMGFRFSRSSGYLSESFRKGVRNKFFAILLALG
jgi:hypothetical protein